MMPNMKTMEITMTRAIPAAPTDVFDAWLDPSHPGTPFNDSKKLILDPKVGGLFYFQHVIEGTELPHFGRFDVLERPVRIVQTWMSKHTSGYESVVTVTFKKKGEGTLLTLTHSNLPDNELSRAHEGGWNHYLEALEKELAPVR